MASVEPANVVARHSLAISGPATVVTFAVALFVSALLLFAVQPMFAKMVLPSLGGSPGVWSVAMVFFQAALLAGYAYAHWLARSLKVGTAAIVHLAFLSATILLLPIVVAEGWGRPPAEGQSFWLIGLFGISVGLPFFAVASTGPLLQAWFSRSGHRHAADPYFLYGASNLGSFAALLLYPVLFEPVLALQQQSLLWSVGFIVLVALIGASAMIVIRPASASAGEGSATPVPAPRWRERAVWAALAFVPSALLVAVTAHIATDIASAPFLWVIPLALYLLTFVVTFQRKPLLPHPLMVRLLPLLVAPLTVLVAVGGATSVTFLIFIHLTFFFVAAMVCHGEMVLRRPPAAHLTEFYLWMSAGGVLGGIFSGLLAPNLFSTVIEYPILIVAALLAQPTLRAMPPATFVRSLLIAGAIVAVAILPALLGVRLGAQGNLIALGCAALVIMALSVRPAIQIGLVVGVILFGGIYHSDLGEAKNFRSFFGVNKVVDTADGRFRTLIHGSTIHGAERLLNEDGTPYDGPPEPTTYYYFGSPLGQVIDAVRNARGGLGRVAAVGLGTGSLACHVRAGEDWRFYEIDAEVVRIARDPANFRFHSICAPETPIVVGDARLTLSDEADGAFDLIVLDAFSSDAVPVHLLTMEALAGYRKKLAPGGVLAFHISNRYMDLAPIVAGSADANGLVTFVGRSETEEMDLATFRSGSIVAVAAADPADLGGLTAIERWVEVPPDPTVRVWTDDYSNILGAMMRRFRQGSS